MIWLLLFPSIPPREGELDRPLAACLANSAPKLSSFLCQLRTIHACFARWIKSASSVRKYRPSKHWSKAWLLRGNKRKREISSRVLEVAERSLKGDFSPTSHCAPKIDATAISQHWYWLAVWGLRTQVFHSCVKKRWHRDQEPAIIAFIAWECEERRKRLDFDVFFVAADAKMDICWKYGYFLLLREWGKRKAVPRILGSCSWDRLLLPLLHSWKEEGKRGKVRASFFLPELR